MAPAERRRGSRDNGLDATDWRAVDDLDPRVSGDVLDLLAARGIAAYVQPAVDIDPVTRSATLPNRPRDRLFVDRQRLQDARESVRRLIDTPGGVPDEAAAGAATSEAATSDVDVAFADIVARFGDPPADPTAEPLADPSAARPTAEQRSADPTAEPVADPAREPVAEVELRWPAGPVDGRHVTEPSLLDALDTFDDAREPDWHHGGADLPDDDEPTEQFIPPPPPPLPRLARQTVLGALAVLAGLVMVVGRPDIVPLDRSSTMLLGFATMLGGATALILRLRPGTDPDDHNHPNDGARV